MTTEEALEVISGALYDTSKELSEGLPGASNSEWGYDERLVLDVAQAVLSWRSRQRNIADPYVVWFFDGVLWKKVSEEKYQEEAYKDWYHFTKNGKVNCDATYETYYFLGSSDLKLEGRHDLSEKEDDDFSIGYLLSKSFGE